MFNPDCWCCDSGLQILIGYKKADFALDQESTDCYLRQSRNGNKSQNRWAMDRARVMMHCGLHYVTRIGYAVGVAAKSVTGFDEPKATGGRAAHKAVFFRPQHCKPSYGRAVRGASRLAGACCLFVNPHCSSTRLTTGERIKRSTGAQQ